MGSFHLTKIKYSLVSILDKLWRKQHIHGCCRISKKLLRATVLHLCLIGLWKSLLQGVNMKISKIIKQIQWRNAHVLNIMLWLQPQEYWTELLSGVGSLRTTINQKPEPGEKYSLLPILLIIYHKLQKEAENLYPCLVWCSLYKGQAVGKFCWSGKKIWPQIHSSQQQESHQCQRLRPRPTPSPPPLNYHHLSGGTGGAAALHIIRVCWRLWERLPQGRSCLNSTQ